MAEAGDGRLRLTILGGYLGSGKTTWLRHQLHAGGFGPRVRVLVNEAAEQPVDDALLAGRAGVEVLAGGCCCCVGRPALLDALRRVCDARSRIAADGRHLERIVLETSGLADPAPILAAIQADPVLVSHILVDETIVAVDALHALAQLRADPLGRRQLAAADRLILTKTDTCDAALLLATLRRLNPHASIEAAVRGEPVPLPAAGAEPADLPPMPDEDPRPVLATPVSVPADLDWADLALWLSALLHARGDDLVRVKGVLRTPAGRLLLQSVRKVVQSPEILPEPDGLRRDDTLVVIGRGYRPEDLNRSLRGFLGGE